MYSQSSSMQEKWAPHMRLAIQYIMEGNNDVVEEFEELRNYPELYQALNLSTMVKSDDSRRTNTLVIMASTRLCLNGSVCLWERGHSKYISNLVRVIQFPQKATTLVEQQSKNIPRVT